MHRAAEDYISSRPQAPRLLPDDPRVSASWFSLSLSLSVSLKAMSSSLPQPFGVHSSYVAPAFAQQRRLHAAGSQEDFKERVRHFYRFWFLSAGTAVDGHAVAPEDIDIEMDTISQHERQCEHVQSRISSLTANRRFSCSLRGERRV